MMMKRQFDHAIDDTEVTEGVSVHRPGMPDEAEPHLRTWMAFGASADLWGDMLVPVQENIALIARTIARFEPVTMLVRATELELAREKCGPGVDFLVCALDDLWMRDTGPVFVKGDNNERLAVDFNFNGWGDKQTHRADRKVAAITAKAAEARIRKTSIVLEGGGIDVDGKGTALITESSLLNENRNPGLSKSAAETQLKALLGLQNIIWLPGIRGRDITDAHVDFYARFAAPSVVVVHIDPDTSSYVHAMTLRHLEILRSSKDASGMPLKIVLLEAPNRVRPEFKNVSFAAGYLNYYVINGAVIMPEFGDELADKKARCTLQELYPDRAIVQINIDCIAAGGGGIHCTTQQEPRWAL
jgi:agmatine deiminase